MPDQEQGVRVADTIRIICVVSSADTTVTFTKITQKLLLVENETIGTVTAKGVTEEERSTGHSREGMSKGTATAKGTTEEERPTSHPLAGTATTINRRQQNEEPL